ncbi:MAG: glucose 1-dehydrogenase [Roseiflexaceae bacterium]
MMLENKVALVTGGNSGIGRAIVLALAQAGAAIAINYHRNRAAAEDVKRQVEQAGGAALIIPGDVAKVLEVQRMVEQTVHAFGRLDIMINNAGVETRTSVLESSERDFDLVIGVNLKGAFFGTQFAAKQMIKQGHGGRIINISSVHEDWPMPGNTPYCCAKGGVRMLTRTAAVELAPHGITVVGVGPGAVATPINQGTLDDPAKKAALNRAIPAGRIAQPEEIANLVVWLASDQSAYVTATTYFIDGGLMQNSVGL